MNPRARRTALMVASVPDDTMRAISAQGTSSHTLLARRTSASHGAPNDSPRSSWAQTASSTSGGRWPRIIGPHEPMKSTYSLPSTSTTRLPRARS